MNRKNKNYQNDKKTKNKTKHTNSILELKIKLTNI